MRIHRVRIDNFRCLRDFERDFLRREGIGPQRVAAVGRANERATVRAWPLSRHSIEQGPLAGGELRNHLVRHAEQREPPAPLVDDLRLFFERVGAALGAA